MIMGDLQIFLIMLIFNQTVKLLLLALEIKKLEFMILKNYNF